MIEKREVVVFPCRVSFSPLVGATTTRRRLEVVANTSLFFVGVNFLLLRSFFFLFFFKVPFRVLEYRSLSLSLSLSLPPLSFFLLLRTIVLIERRGTIRHQEIDRVRDDDSFFEEKEKEEEEEKRRRKKKRKNRAGGRYDAQH
jgi:hypothetical protein